MARGRKKSDFNIENEKSLVVLRAKLIFYTGPGGYDGKTYEDVKNHLSKFTVYPNPLYHGLANKIKQIDEREKKEKEGL